MSQIIYIPSKPHISILHFESLKGPVIDFNERCCLERLIETLPDSNQKEPEFGEEELRELTKDSIDLPFYDPEINIPLQENVWIQVPTKSLNTFCVLKTEVSSMQVVSLEVLKVTETFKLILEIDIIKLLLRWFKDGRKNLWNPNEESDFTFLNSFNF